MIKRKSGAPRDGDRITIEINLPVSSSQTDGRERAAPVNPAEAVGDYLADMIAQLECLARATNKEMLAYLLAMASVQASAPEARWDRSNALH